MKEDKIFDKKQRIIFFLIAGLALTIFYFSAKDYCAAGLRCESSYCEATRSEVEKTCVTRGMIIFSVPIVLAANAVSAGIVFVGIKIIKRKSK